MLLFAPRPPYGPIRGDPDVRVAPSGRESPALRRQRASVYDRNWWRVGRCNGFRLFGYRLHFEPHDLQCHRSYLYRCWHRGYWHRCNAWLMENLAQLKVNVKAAGTPDGIVSNIRAAIARGLPELVPSLIAHDGHMVIVGSGPSMPGSSTRPVVPASVRKSPEFAGGRGVASSWPVPLTPRRTGSKRVTFKVFAGAESCTGSPRWRAGLALCAGRTCLTAPSADTPRASHQKEQGSPVSSASRFVLG